MSWSITRAGSPSDVAAAFRKRVETEKGQSHQSESAKGVLEAHAAAVESFVGGLTTPEGPDYPRIMIVESSGHVDSSSGSFKLEARVTY